jgi:hypothetical protein
MEGAAGVIKTVPVEREEYEERSSVSRGFNVTE